MNGSISSSIALGCFLLLVTDSMHAQEIADSRSSGGFDREELADEGPQGPPPPPNAGRPGSFKTPEQLWRGTGVDRGLFKWMGLFSNRNCKASLENFNGCVAGCGSIAGEAREKLKLVPASLAKESDVVKNFGPLVFIKETAERRSFTSLVKLRKEVKQENERRDQELEKIFNDTKSSGGSGVDFEKICAFASKAGFHDPGREAMIAGNALNAYLRRSKDPHASVQPTEAMMMQLKLGSLKLAGVGIDYEIVDGKAFVGRLAESGPARKAGLKVDDLITKIDGKSIEGLSEDRMQAMITGKSGTPVRLTVRRGSSTFEVKMVREQLHLEPVSLQMKGDAGKKVAHIRLRNFVDQSGCQGVKRALMSAEAEGAAGVVLDLRGNGGGLVDQGICVGRLFVGDKEIVKVKNLRSNRFEPLPKAPNLGQATKLPVVVLIDARSASASEIVAGALQDHRRAWIVGDRSFGKGTVQQYLPSEISPALVEAKTVQRFYQPSGRTNQINGILPDVAVSSKPNTNGDNFALREADIFPGALKAQGKPWVQPRPEEAQRLSQCMASGRARLKWSDERGSKTDDYQLLAAEDAIACL